MWLHFFLSLQKPLNAPAQLKYLVPLSLHRWRNSASQSAWSHWTVLAKANPGRLRQPGLSLLIVTSWLGSGEGGVIGDHCGLGQSTYEEVSGNGPVSVFKKQQLEHLRFIDKDYHEKYIPWYTFTFYLTKTVDMVLTLLVVVIQANEKGCMAQPTLTKYLWISD